MELVLFSLFFWEETGRGRKRENWDSSLERETAGLPIPLYFKVVDIINDYQVESHYTNWFFLCCFPFILFEMVNSSNLPNNYNVTEQATSLVESVYRMVHKLMIALCWDVVSEWHRLSRWTVLQCGPLLRTQGFPSHTWHHYYKILNKLSNISFKRMRRN